MNRGMKTATAVAFLVLTGVALDGSSHREAPGITKSPKVDGTDFYMFRSYEPGREGHVTLAANYVPLQDVYGGPNVFTLDPDAVYEIHVDNAGDGREDITFQFQARNRSRDLAVPVGDRMVAIPLVNIGGIGPAADDNASLNVLETYSVTMIRGDRRFGRRDAIRNAADGRTTFRNRPIASATSRCGTTTPRRTPLMPTTISTTSRFLDAQSDRMIGLPLELVAERNPYALGPREELPVRLLYQNQPLAGALVVAVNRLNPGQILKARSDAEGRVKFVLPVSGLWLIKAVHMIPAPDQTKADWASVWASLTFELVAAAPANTP